MWVLGFVEFWKPITIYNISSAFESAYQLALTIKNMQSDFRDCIRTFDENVFDDTAFQSAHESDHSSPDVD